MKSSERFTTALLDSGWSCHWHSKRALQLELPSTRTLPPGRTSIWPASTTRSFGGDSFSDDNLIALPLPEFHRAKFGSVVRLHHVNERPLLADLRGLIRNQHGSLFRGQNELHIHKLARPEMMVGVAQWWRAGSPCRCRSARRYRGIRRDRFGQRFRDPKEVEPQPSTCRSTSAFELAGRSPSVTVKFA